MRNCEFSGTFPCSVCGKVFCHSSSLSRHRMQAHFKSYTCTQCNQEISSCSGNETLRSHMFRIHSISRMFMCRCCNWAYPDKTSLHIHMQSMLRNGTPGDVSVLARSSSDGPGMAGVVGEMSPRELEGSPSVSPPEVCGNESPPGEQTHVKSSLFGNGNGLLDGSIFPATLSNTDSLFRFTSKQDNLLAQMNTDTSSQNSWLAAWLANNAFTVAPFNSTNLLTVSNNAENINLQKEGATSTNIALKMEPKDDEQISNGIDISAPKSTSVASPSKTPNSTSSQECKRSVNGSTLDDLLEKKGLSVTRNHRNKRKASNPQQLRASTAFVGADDEDDEGFAALPRKQNIVDTNIKIEDYGKSLNGCLPPTATTVSRTTPNGVTLVDASTSPIKSCDCTVLKAKCGVAETRNQSPETKILNHETEIDHLDIHLTGLDKTLRQFEHEKEELRHQIEIFEEILIGYQQSALAALALLQSGGPDAIPAIKKLMENLLQ
ncbi:zinc finger, C2H2 type [Onchocerca flexuosa]|uniref:Zinc finger, C2H2 type n=1 Tax=Onchocerca flexuosa TaxID=387005 RepID=A0A238C106_9BILA|nr:zinc finger, C2H2 type [Onchocerca flexuosa]